MAELGACPRVSVPDRAQKFPVIMGEAARVGLSLQPPVLGPPAVEGGLTDLQLLGHLGNLRPLAQHPVSLPKLAHDLLRSVLPDLLSGHALMVVLGRRYSRGCSPLASLTSGRHHLPH